MRYVIVCEVGGEGGRFNNQLRKEVYEKLGAKSSTLPAHFTIKAPFEYDGIPNDLDMKLEQFCKHEKAASFRLEGYNHFDDRVIYMDVVMSKEGKALHDRLIDTLVELPYLTFDKKDGKDKVFHVTVSSKKIQPIYSKLWDYVHQYPCQFECSFDNITLYKWEEHKWVVHKAYHISK